MRSRLRRFAAVGVVATAVDVVSFVLLHEAGLGLVGADVVALVAAAIVSFTLHRAVTLRADPLARWLHHTWMFATVVLVAGAVDVGVLVLAADGDRVVVPKLLAVAVAAVVRAVAYRQVLFRVVRREQDAPSNRPPAPGRYRLTVVVPAYREQERIARTVERLRSELAPIADNGGLEIVVVDDGSDDATATHARAAGADQVLELERNRGKGGAVRVGVLAANGRTIVFTDADLAYAPVQILDLLERVEAGWDVVVGNRRHDDTQTIVRAVPLREIGSRLVNLATHALLLGQYRDTQCGLKAFRSDVARVLFSSGRLDGFAFDIELFHLVERYRLSLAEVPVSVENSDRSSVRAVRDGVRVLADILRIRRWARQGHYDHPRAELPPRASTSPSVADAR
ncbi:MAG TPA: glycosyltransferase [Acidimicrobiales bacterium]